MPRRSHKINDELYTRGGIITERDPDFCIVRLRMPAGMITPAQMKGVGEIATRHGIENIHLTTRQTMEFPHVDSSILEELSMILRQMARRSVPNGKR